LKASSDIQVFKKKCEIQSQNRLIFRLKKGQ